MLKNFREVKVQKNITKTKTRRTRCSRVVSAGPWAEQSQLCLERSPFKFVLLIKHTFIQSTFKNKIFTNKFLPKVGSLATEPAQLPDIDSSGKRCAENHYVRTAKVTSYCMLIFDELLRRKHLMLLNSCQLFHFL